MTACVSWLQERNLHWEQNLLHFWKCQKNKCFKVFVTEFIWLFQVFIIQYPYAWTAKQVRRLQVHVKSIWKKRGHNFRTNSVVKSFNQFYKYNITNYITEIVHFLATVCSSFKQTHINSILIWSDLLPTFIII
jgi:hypothetical protein